MKTKKAVFLIDRNFQDEEVAKPLDFLRENGVKVDLVALAKGEYCGKYGREKVKVTKTFDDASPADYDAVVIPGGGAPEYLRVNERVIDFVKYFVANELIVAAICHGPQVLISTGMMKGRHMTSYVGIRDDLRFAGALYSDDVTVQDEKLITARKPEDIDTFNHAILWALTEEERHFSKSGLPKDISPTTALKIAIRKEIAANVFYSEMARNATDESLSSRFMFLAANERDHILFFQSALRQMTGGLVYTSSKLFGNSNFARDISRLPVRDVLNYAMEAESEAHAMYQAAAKRSTSKAMKKLWTMLAAEEQGHMQMIEHELCAKAPRSLSSSIETIPYNLEDRW